MRQKLLTAALACAAFAGYAIAQEGHPITGTWHGDWGPSASQRNPLVMFLKWENLKITGTVNPGRNSYELTSVTLDAEKWMVHFEGETKDGQKVVADGKMEDIGSYNRTISGTWTQGGTKGTFKLTRD
jgi:3-hydroxymyristoyl/3-hydroxydecanoyl-(acyl carrier protein) dehydratase